MHSAPGHRAVLTLFGTKRSQVQILSPRPHQTAWSAARHELSGSAGCLACPPSVSAGPGLGGGGIHAMAGNSTGSHRAGRHPDTGRVSGPRRRTQVTEQEDPMQLDLSDDDVELVKDVLDTALDRLTSEIGHTDNPVYRQNLKG